MATLEYVDARGHRHVVSGDESSLLDFRRRYGRDMRESKLILNQEAPPEDHVQILKGGSYIPRSELQTTFDGPISQAPKEEPIPVPVWNWGSKPEMVHATPYGHPGVGIGVTDDESPPRQAARSKAANRRSSDGHKEEPIPVPEWDWHHKPARVKRSHSSDGEEPLPETEWDW
jgi:hypothetical protein